MSLLKQIDSEVCEHDRTADMLKALGHPVRLQAVQQLLSQTQVCCGELCECFDHSQSTISQHLGVLRDAGVLVAKKHGNRTLYSINPDTFSFLETVFVNFAAQAEELDHS